MLVKAILKMFFLSTPLTLLSLFCSVFEADHSEGIWQLSPTDSSPLLAFLAHTAVAHERRVFDVGVRVCRPYEMLQSSGSGD